MSTTALSKIYGTLSIYGFYFAINAAEHEHETQKDNLQFTQRIKSIYVKRNFEKCTSHDNLSMKLQYMSICFQLSPLCYKTQYSTSVASYFVWFLRLHYLAVISNVLSTLVVRNYTKIAIFYCDHKTGQSTCRQAQTKDIQWYNCA